MITGMIQQRGRYTLEESINFQEQSTSGVEKKGIDIQGEGLAFGRSKDTSVTATGGKMENRSINTGRYVDIY